MQAKILKPKSYTSLLAIILVSLLSSCAAVGNIIEPSAWIGALDLVTAVGIAIFIFKGSSK